MCCTDFVEVIFISNTNFVELRYEILLGLDVSQMLGLLEIILYLSVNVRM
jgi:hypothetical protein